jgi:hypothetical protein
MTKTIDSIKLTSKNIIPMNMYMDIVEETQKGTRGIDLALKYNVSYNIITRIRMHARKAGLLELDAKSTKMVQTKRTRKNQRKYKMKMDEARRQREEAPVPTPRAIQTQPNTEQEFVKVNFKGTEIHVEKTGKIFVTSEGIIVK